MALAGQKLRSTDLTGIAVDQRVLAGDSDGISDPVAGQPVKASQVD